MNAIIRATETYDHRAGDITIKANRNPSREELVAEAKAVFSDPKRAMSLKDVERIKDSKTGTTVSLTGRPKINPYLENTYKPFPGWLDDRMLRVRPSRSPQRITYPNSMPSLGPFKSITKSEFEKLFLNFSPLELAGLKFKDRCKVFAEGVSSAGIKDFGKVFAEGVSSAGKDLSKLINKFNNIVTKLR